MTYDANGPAQTPVDTAAPFDEMSARIAKNDPEDFAGANAQVQVFDGHFLRLS